MARKSIKIGYNSNVKSVATQASSGAQELAKCFTKETDQYVTHEDGTVERTSKTSYEQMRYFLLGRRVYDREEMMESCNKWCVNYMVQIGHAKKIGHFYWITKKGADYYKLPNRCSGFEFEFVD